MLGEAGAWSKFSLFEGATRVPLWIKGVSASVQTSTVAKGAWERGGVDGIEGGGTEDGTEGGAIVGGPGTEGGAVVGTEGGAIVGGPGTEGGAVVDGAVVDGDRVGGAGTDGTKDCTEGGAVVADPVELVSLYRTLADLTGTASTPLSSSQPHNYACHWPIRAPHWDGEHAPQLLTATQQCTPLANQSTAVNSNTNCHPSATHPNTPVLTES